jgi:hypothetical protein
MDFFKSDVMLQKGVYPYEYMSDVSKFYETDLPPKSAFYSKLIESDITDEEFEYAQKIFKLFECKTLRDYHDLYLKSDVLLLADIFQNFRHLSIDIYGLDPAHYYTLPSLSFDALLKYTGIELELLTDADIYQFFEAGIRGGVASINHRLAETNNKYMGDRYDPSKESTYILYLDMNNLYGSAMSQNLPVKNFAWVPENEFTEFLNKLPTIGADSNIGYVLEVDLEYPPHLHDLHSSLPLAPEKLTIPYSDLSTYCKSFPYPYVNTPKLVPNLHNKKKYIIHYRNLQLYVKLGMNVTKIHRILQFHQEPWMKPYIDLNTKLRQQASSVFEQTFFKQVNNDVYG